MGIYNVVKKAVGVLTLGAFLNFYTGCSSDNNNPVGPSKPKPETEQVELNSVNLPSLTNQNDISAKLYYNGDCDSAVVDVDGDEQRIALNPDSTIDFTLPSGDGSKNINVKVKSKKGKYSNTAGGIVELDQTAPVASNLILPSKTNSTSIDGIIESVDADSVKFFGNVSDSAFKTYKDTMSLLLSSGDGVKTVYLVLKDKAGNLSDTLQRNVELDNLAPNVPAGFKDTTLYDNVVNLGNFDVNGLVNNYFTKKGATVDSGSLVNINDSLFKEGTTYVAIFMDDGANVTKDTARVVARKLDSLGSLSEVLSFYSAQGHNPSDSGIVVGAIDTSTYKNYSEMFDYSFDVNTLKHHVKVGDVPDSVKAVYDVLNGFGQVDRALIIKPDFKTPIGEKLLNFYNNNK